MCYCFSISIELNQHGHQIFVHTISIIGPENTISQAREKEVYKKSPDVIKSPYI